MQKVTAFSKTKFCSSRDIIIISVLHFMSKQTKVSFFCLLSGRRQPAPEAPTYPLCFLWIWWCVGREGSTVPTARMFILNWPLKCSPSWGKRIRLHKMESFFWVLGFWLRRLLKQLREKVTTALLTNCRPDLGMVSRSSSATDLLPDLE